MGEEKAASLLSSSLLFQPTQQQPGRLEDDKVWRVWTGPPARPAAEALPGRTSAVWPKPPEPLFHPPATATATATARAGTSFIPIALSILAALVPFQSVTEHRAVWNWSRITPEWSSQLRWAYSSTGGAGPPLSHSHTHSLSRSGNTAVTGPGRLTSGTAPRGT